MPLENPPQPLNDRVAELNTRFENHSATQLLANSLHDPQIGQTALVSSFGAGSVVLLHMVSLIDRTLPVIFLDTEMLFPQTLTYQRELAERFRLSDLRIIRPTRDALFKRDNDALLHQRAPDACCHLRKTEPLQNALGSFNAWITGRKRVDTDARARLKMFEVDEQGRIKINPLANWSTGDVQDYIENNRLPRHPLVKSGFTSIGCQPCTTGVKPGEDARAGRWRGREKNECGIHFAPPPPTRNAA